MSPEWVKYGFDNLSDWWTWRESNPQKQDFKSRAFSGFATRPNICIYFSVYWQYTKSTQLLVMFFFGLSCPPLFSVYIISFYEYFVNWKNNWTFYLFLCFCYAKLQYRREDCSSLTNVWKQHVIQYIGDMTKVYNKL